MTGTGPLLFQFEQQKVRSETWNQHSEVATSEACDVNRPIINVGALMDKGIAVHIDKKNSLLTLEHGLQFSLIRQRGLFYLPVVVEDETRAVQPKGNIDMDGNDPDADSNDDESILPVAVEEDEDDWQEVDNENITVTVAGDGRQFTADDQVRQTLLLHFLNFPTAVALIILYTGDVHAHP